MRAWTNRSISQNSMRHVSHRNLARGASVGHPRGRWYYDLPHGGAGAAGRRATIGCSVFHAHLTAILYSFDPLDVVLIAGDMTVAGLSRTGRVLRCGGDASGSRWMRPAGQSDISSLHRANPAQFALSFVRVNALADGMLSAMAAVQGGRAYHGDNDPPIGAHAR